MGGPWAVSLSVQLARRPVVTLGLVRAHQMLHTTRGFWGGDEP